MDWQTIQAATENARTWNAHGPWPWSTARSGHPPKSADLPMSPNYRRSSLPTSVLEPHHQRTTHTHTALPRTPDAFPRKPCTHPALSAPLKLPRPAARPPQCRTGTYTLHANNSLCTPAAYTRPDSAAPAPRTTSSPRTTAARPPPKTKRSPAPHTQRRPTAAPAPAPPATHFPHPRPRPRAPPSAHTPAQMPRAPTAAGPSAARRPTREGSTALRRWTSWRARTMTRRVC
jgi:hypothetical protein